MELLVGTVRRDGHGGVQTYVRTTVESLEALGHRVAVVSPERPLPDGLPVPDAILAQDTMSAYALAERFPGVPQLFVAHGDADDLSIPPGVPGVVGAAVALHDRVADRLRAVAGAVPVVRLRQPIDVERFRPRRPPAAAPRTAAVFARYLRGERLDALLGACARAGIECAVVGGPGAPAEDAAAAMHDADIVFGKARVILEAMACGRPAYVYDHNGAAGWVTPARYRELEADNFGGQLAARPFDAASLAADLEAYDPAMGLANRDLVVRHHHAGRHAEALVRALRELAPAAPPPDAAAELGRAARVAHRHEERAAALQWAIEERTRSLAAAEARAADAEARLQAVVTSRRWRFARALAAPLDAWRRRGG